MSPLPWQNSADHNEANSELFPRTVVLKREENRQMEFHRIYLPLEIHWNC